MESVASLRDAQNVKHGTRNVCVWAGKAAVQQIHFLNPIENYFNPV